MNSSSGGIDIDLSTDSPEIFEYTSLQRKRLRSPKSQNKQVIRLKGGKSPGNPDEITQSWQPSNVTTDQRCCETFEKLPKKCKTKSAIIQSTDPSSSKDSKKKQVFRGDAEVSSNTRQSEELNAFDLNEEDFSDLPNITATSRKKSGIAKHKKVKLAISMIIDPSFDTVDGEYRLSAEFAVLEYLNFTVSDGMSIPVKADRALFIIYPSMVDSNGYHTLNNN